MKFTRSAKFALATAASAALAVSLLTPAQANTRSTVVIHHTNVQTGLNCSTTTTNSTVCTDQAALTGMGFNYYNDKKELIKNTVFGNYKVIRTQRQISVFSTQLTQVAYGQMAHQLLV